MNMPPSYATWQIRREITVKDVSYRGHQAGHLLLPEFVLLQQLRRQLLSERLRGRLRGGLLQGGHGRIAKGGVRRVDTAGIGACFGHRGRCTACQPLGRGSRRVCCPAWLQWTYLLVAAAESCLQANKPYYGCILAEPHVCW